jgi:NADH dehydrogenase
MRILILGAGYAGLRAALDLGQAKGHGHLPGSVQVDLVERAECHRVIFWMHQVAAGTVDADDACIDYGDLPLEHIALHRAEVQALDPERASVTTSAGDFAYDALVVALGSRAAVPDLPGLAAQAHTLRDRAGAEALHHALEHAFGRAGVAGSPAEQARWATVAVAGGGFTGCQLAGELAHRLPDLADRHGVPIRHVRLVLVEAADRLLPHMAACHGRSARRILETKGVEVRTGAPLERVSEDTLTAGGSGLAYGTLAWAGGIHGPALLEATGLDRDAAGRLRVDRFLRAPAHPEIRAAGDCAVRIDAPATEATATEAIHQGRYLATALREEAHGRLPAPYRPNRLGLLVALGDGDAVGTVGPAPLAGRAAGILKNAAERTYPDTLRGVSPEAFLDPDFQRPI